MESGTTVNKIIMNQNLIPLLSVGTILNTVTLATYAMPANQEINENIIDKDEAVCLTDCSDEWFNSLSEQDLIIVESFLKK